MNKISTVKEKDSRPDSQIAGQSPESSRLDSSVGGAMTVERIKLKPFEKP